MDLIFGFLKSLAIFFEKVGYPGIFFCMFLESTILPLPSELVIPPAAYLASQGKMNVMWVILMGGLGTLAGALLNYYVALKIGRPAVLLFLKKKGKYFLLTEENLFKVEIFWEKHGAFSTFIGRLLPGIRHLIPIPAGFARMKLSSFCIFTFLGATIWCGFLGICGYMFGQNQELLKTYLHHGSILVLIICAIITGAYIFYKRQH